MKVESPKSFPQRFLSSVGVGGEEFVMLSLREATLVEAEEEELEVVASVAVISAEDHGGGVSHSTLFVANS